MGANGHTIQELLGRLGPTRSSTVVKALVERGANAAAARQAVARAALKRLDLHLPRGESFVYLEPQRHRAGFYDAVRVALAESGAAAGWAIEAIGGRGGRIPLPIFHSKSGSPRGEQIGHLVSEQILKILEENSILERRTGLDGAVYVQFTDVSRFPVISERSTRARLLAEEALLATFKDWSAKLGLTGFDDGRVRTPAAGQRVGSFEWDFTGPCYLSPLARRKRGSETMPGFVVADVCLGSRLSPLAITFALRKGATYRSGKNALPALQLLVADGFEPDALHLGKSNGLLMATPGNLFGRALASALRELISTMTDAAQEAVKDPERLYRILSGLAHSEGAACQIRGPMLELATFVAASLLEAGEVRFAERARTASSEEADIDVLIVQNQIRTLAIECKGTLGRHEVGVETVKDWLTRQVPRIDEHVLERYKPATREYELWTTGNLSADAHAFMSEKQRLIQRYRVACRSGEQVRDYFARTKNEALQKLLNEFYLAHPIVKAKLRTSATDATTDEGEAPDDLA